MMWKGMGTFALVPALALGLAGCGKSAASVEGTYNMVNGPVPGVVATFGKDSFALSTGASGSYEVSDGKAILSGGALAGAYRIEGEKLVGDRFTFARRDPNDKTPIAGGPRG